MKKRAHRKLTARVPRQSIRQQPPICSLVSANGPSEIRTLPSRTWTVVSR
jgi:hypothetical protein